MAIPTPQDGTSTRTVIEKRRPSFARRAARVLLGGALVFAGTSHLTFARQEFQAQVPKWVPTGPDTTVLASGVVEIALGTALIRARKRRRTVGMLAALFFTAIFPGNLSQFLNQRNGFGLNSDLARGNRLLFQPVLVLWAIWSTRR